MREILRRHSVSLELHLGYVTNGRESELSVVLREALWAYIEYKRIPPNPRLGAMTIIPLTIIKFHDSCNDYSYLKQHNIF